MDEKSRTVILRSPAQTPLAQEHPSCEAPRLYFIVLSGGITGSMLPIQPGGNWIGRSPDNTIYLPDPSVSRKHALLEVDRDGHAAITDLESSNGTLVNGEPIEPCRPYRLQDGDRLMLGSTMFLKFVRPDACEEQFQRELFERSVRDGLTGLYNRLYFMERVGPLGIQAQQYNLGLAVILVDLDHFKQVNDQHGHPVGDRVLAEVANVLRQCTRADDLVARLGGEEFVIALPATSLSAATGRAETIRRSIARRRPRGEGGTLSITASLGVAFAPFDQPRSFSALFSEADRWLYQAKKDGRNRVAWDPSGPGSGEDGTKEAIFPGDLARMCELEPASTPPKRVFNAEALTALVDGPR